MYSTRVLTLKKKKKKKLHPPKHFLCQTRVLASLCHNNETAGKHTKNYNFQSAQSNQVQPIIEGHRFVPLVPLNNSMLLNLWDPFFYMSRWVPSVFGFQQYLETGKLPRLMPMYLPHSQEFRYSLLIWYFSSLLSAMDPQPQIKKKQREEMRKKKKKNLITTSLTATDQEKSTSPSTKHTHSHSHSLTHSHMPGAGSLHRLSTSFHHLADLPWIYGRWNNSLLRIRYLAKYLARGSVIMCKCMMLHRFLPK